MVLVGCTRMVYTHKHLCFQLDGVLKCHDIVIALMSNEALCLHIHRKWEEISQFQQILKPLYQATIVMQKSDFAMSDFYASYKQVHHKMGKLIRRYPEAKLAASLKTCLEKREPQLTEKSAMLCALALDPRFCNALDEEKKKKATDALLNVWRKIRSFFRSIDEQLEDSSDDDITIRSTTLMRYMKPHSKSIFTTNIFEMADKLLSFIAAEHDVPDGTIYDFWELKQLQYPEIYKLAQIVFAITPTQAIVERSFSVLSHIFPPKRSQLSEKHLDDILTICLNKQLLDVINLRDISNISNVETEIRN